MTSACLFDMIIDDKNELASMIPSKKRIKIANSTDLNDNLIININLKKEDDLKRIFPFLSSDLIEDILKKTSNNIEKASNMVHSLNTENFAKNSNFVSMHQSNKKRRFNQLEDCEMNYPKQELHNNLIIQRSNATSTIISNYELPTNLKMNTEGPKKLNVQEEVDKIINVAKHSNSMIELKSFIKAKILSYLSIEDKRKINETKLKLEKYISDNKDLKQALISMYAKYENNLNQIKEKEELLIKIDDLKEEINLEKLRGNHLHKRLLHYDTSNRLNIEETRDIY